METDIDCIVSGNKRVWSCVFIWFHIFGGGGAGGTCQHAGFNILTPLPISGLWKKEKKRKEISAVFAAVSPSRSHLCFTAQTTADWEFLKSTHAHLTSNEALKSSERKLNYGDILNAKISAGTPHGLGSTLCRRRAGATETFSIRSISRSRQAESLVSF